MSNVTVKGTFKDLCSYLPTDGEGVSNAIDLALRSLTPAARAADDLGLYIFPAISTTKQEISDTAGARPILIVVQSTGTLSYVHFHDLDADSVTEGVDANFVVPVAGTANEITWVLCGGRSWLRFWDVGLTVSGSTTVEASAAPTNPPNVWVLYTLTTT